MEVDAVVVGVGQERPVDENNAIKHKFLKIIILTKPLPVLLETPCRNVVGRERHLHAPRAAVAVLEADAARLEVALEKKIKF